VDTAVSCEIMDQIGHLFRARNKHTKIFDFAKSFWIIGLPGKLYGSLLPSFNTKNLPQHSFKVFSFFQICWNFVYQA
jgi:hypothetical protein